MDKINDFLLNLFFPKFCLECQKEGLYLCEDCREILDISEFNFCLCSKNPIRTSQQSTGKCKNCANKKLSGLYSATHYKDNFLIKKLIYQFKYPPYLKDLAETLANIIAEHLVLSKNNSEIVWQNSVLIPVPIDKEKQKIRGYNQTEELAKELAKILKTPILTEVLIKTKKTKSQAELSQKERETNLIGAFMVNSALQKQSEEKIDLIKNKKIFLVDDVYTTGSTMEECAKILLQSGAKQVWGIVLARESL